MQTQNRAALRLSRAHSERGAKARLAELVEIDQGYLGRLLTGERTPSAELRLKFWRLKKIPMHWWDEPVPQPNQSASR